ncbi:unnamed protein product [Brachionus calyciflorus]|uniref:Uncharacterized protein n=1 Tax=Brachionus calyciflorus TaxID=104777 RepID=A0A813QDA4_9BILA|nr:unnamed protein product [Brachionus calyciflorus]
MFKLYFAFLISKLIRIVSSQNPMQFCGGKFCLIDNGPVTCCGYKNQYCCYNDSTTLIMAGSTIIGGILGICLLILIIKCCRRGLINMQNKRRDLPVHMSTISTVNVLSSSSLSNKTLVQPNNELCQ